MQLVDTHCHPHFDEISGPEVLKRASKAGVNKVIAVGVSLEDSRRAIDYAASHQNVWATAGIHPHEAKDFGVAAGMELKKLLNMSSIVGAGEIGLDYYRLNSPKEEQLSALRAQIEITQPTGLPFTFHVRDAWKDFWQVFDEYRGLKGVVHSFTGGPKQLEQALSRGLYVALNGIVTFTRDQAMLLAAQKVPLDRLVLETDAPFLLPVGAKEKTCEPMHVRNVAEFLAKLRGESLEEIAAATSKNAEEIFNLK